MCTSCTHAHTYLHIYIHTHKHTHTHTHRSSHLERVLLGDDDGKTLVDHHFRGVTCASDRAAAANDAAKRVHELLQRATRRNVRCVLAQGREGRVRAGFREHTNTPPNVCPPAGYVAARPLPLSFALYVPTCFRHFCSSPRLQALQLRHESTMHPTPT